MPSGLIEPFALQNLFCDGMVIVPGCNDVLHFLAMPSSRCATTARSIAELRALGQELPGKRFAGSDQISCFMERKRNRARASAPRHRSRYRRP